MAIELLLSTIESGPLLPRGAADQVAAYRPAIDVPEPPTLDASDGLEDLRRQHWGLVVPQRARERVEWIAPLVELRQREMADRSLTVLEVPPGVDDTTAALGWRTRYYDRLRDRPRYLLILGDLHEISLAVQQMLGITAYVGRLCFNDIDGTHDPHRYHDYAVKLAEIERQNATWVERPRLLFFATRDTADRELREHHASVFAHTYYSLEGDETLDREHLLRLDDPAGHQWDELRQHAAQEHPGVLFSLAHGLAESDRLDQRRRQGTLYLPPPPGSPSGSFVEPEELSRGPFLNRGFWIYKACFGAGTPTISAYHELLRQLEGDNAPAVRRAREFLAPRDARPFVARLPQVVLANPRGPLGFLGHVDIDWGYAYQAPTLSRTGFVQVFRQASAYARLTDSLARGHRFGLAMTALNRQAMVAASALAIDETQELPADERGARARLELRAHLRLQYLDLRGYILLGDPAARLPVRPSVETVPGAATPSELAPARRSRSLSASEAQEAVLRHIRGESLPDIARDLPIDDQELAEAVSAYRSAGFRVLQELFPEPSR